MANQTREIKRRIRSVTNTKKITKAMELVAAAKMRKAVAAVLASRDYASRAWEVVLNLARRTDPELHPMLAQRPIKKIGVVLIAANRGLVGGFNSQIVRTVADYAKRQAVPVEIILAGKRGVAVHKRFGLPITADFVKQDVITSAAEVQELSHFVIGEYSSGRYDAIALAYTDFRSTLSQVPTVRPLLPIAQPMSGLGETKPVTDTAGELGDYIFEPTADRVLEAMLRRLVELQLYQAVLESNASEHSARMVAMRSATDNAQGFIEDLTLTYNQARQAAITAELADISAGRAAVE